MRVVLKYNKLTDYSFIKMKGGNMFSKFAGLFSLLLIPVYCYSADSVTVVFNYNSEGIPESIVVEGVAKENRWLGVSFYPTTFTDALKEGYHMVREIMAGNFREEFKMDNHLLEHYSSSYEIALWKNKVEKANCKIENCHWCNMRGYHLEGLLFYQSGYFNTLWREK